MAILPTTFYGISSDSVSTLFSSLNNSKTNNMSSIGNMLSDYYSIKSGSYKKLLTAYYDKFGEDASPVVSRNNSTAADSTKLLASVKSASEDLYDSADALVDKGSSSVFAKKNGKYDMDAIYDGVKKFVDDYNEVIDNTEDARSKSIARTTDNMIDQTKFNEKKLAELGITIGKDDKLSINEEVFKASKVSDVKSMFNGAGSYAYLVSAKASQLTYNVNTEANRANTYTNNGRYNYNYSAGDIYDSLF